METEMKACDFEKDANAEVLFDKGNLKQDGFYRHFVLNIKSICLKEQIFVWKMPDILMRSGRNYNLNNGKIDITHLIKNLSTKIKSTNFIPLCICVANVRPGSIIELNTRDP